MSETPSGRAFPQDFRISSESGRRLGRVHRSKSANEKDSTRARIGITGHRILTELDKLQSGIDRVVERLSEAFPEDWTVISALAEGADLLVARQILARPRTRLVAVLPLPRTEYENDFGSNHSKREFRHLLGRADQVIEISPQPDREAAYEAGGHVVLDLSSVLVALWDGRSSRGVGGTGAIVNQARRRHIPLAWVHAGNCAPGSQQPTSLGALQGTVTFERLQHRNPATQSDPASQLDHEGLGN